MGDNAKHWSRVASNMRRALHLAPLSGKEADAELAKTEPIPLSDQKIQEIVHAATATNTIGRFDADPDYGSESAKP